MEDRAALRLFNNELRTIYLNVLYYNRRENAYKAIALASDVGIAALVCTGLVLTGAGKTSWALGVQLVTAVVAFLRVYEAIRGQVSKYAFMRGKYYSLFVDARAVHQKYAGGQLSARELTNERERLINERQRLAELEDVPSSTLVRKLQRKVNEYLPVEVLWPSHLWPRED